MLAIISSLADIIPDEITNCQNKQNNNCNLGYFHGARVCLTKKAEPPPTRGVNRDSGTASANGGWLRRLVRHRGHLSSKLCLNRTTLAIGGLVVKSHLQYKITPGHSK